MVSFETLGGDTPRLISVEAAHLGELDEKLSTTRKKTDLDAVRDHIALLANQLHHIARIESFLNGKTLQIIEELHKLQGHLTAKEKNLQNAHHQMKIQNKTTSDPHAHKELEAQLRQVGEVIRYIEGLIANIETVERNVVSGVRRDMSTLRLIGQRAEQ